MQQNNLGRGKSLAMASVAVAACWSAAGTAWAGYTLKTLVTFDGTDNGANPEAGLILSGSTLYGTTSYGGASGDGTVFSVPVTGGSPTTLATFNNVNGQYPLAGLILSNNMLYGTTDDGGNNGSGTVFSVPVTGGSPNTLATFDGTGNGANPEGGLILTGSRLYGTTNAGGSSGLGTVFSLPVTGGAPDTLLTFNGSNGAEPVAGLTLSGSTLYGTSSGGAGAYGHGTVFSVPVTGGLPATLATFTTASGDNPQAGLIVSGDTLYGVTNEGGTNGDGTVFSLPVTGGSPTTLATFNYSNGAYPYGGLTLSGNTLFGTTQGGGVNGQGTVFSVPVAGGSPTTLFTFNNTNGSQPYGGLTVSGSTLYGTTYSGGTNSVGTVFSLTLNPILSLTTTAPTAFGSKVGTLALTGNHGSYNAATASFAATPTGYLAVSGFNPSSDTEVYALDLTDSTPANLAADLADAAAEINAGTYTGFALTASTTDPLTILSSGYDFYVTITDDTLGTGSPYLGFDFTQLNGTSDTLSATAAAAVPEPTSVGLLALSSLALLRRRRGK